MNSDAIAIGPRIRTLRTDSVCVQVVPVDVEQVVSVQGSFRTAPDFASGEDLVQDVAVSLLDAGTRDRDKQAIAVFLEDRGASVSFSASGPRVHFSVRCLKRDLWDVLDVLSEEIRRPAMPEAEFRLAVQRFAADLQRQASHTATRASRLLARHMFPEGHPNRSESVEQNVKRLMETGLEETASFAAGRLRPDELNVVAVGDLEGVDPERLRRALMVDWVHGKGDFPKYTDSLSSSAEPEHFEIADRPNLDVRIGHSIALRKPDPDALALTAGVTILGGNFSSRLMTIVRDEQGLTYGIRSRISGLDRLYAGAWSTAVTLSLDNLDRGIAASMDQIRAFVRDGVTSEELEDCKTTMTGNYEVSLASTQGIAHTLLGQREQGFPDDRIDEWPELVRALTLEEVNRAIQAHLDPERLAIKTAGTKA